jgi:L-alanine-DL-glutamate epimerase-like enolase superfamily enzyme
VSAERRIVSVDLLQVDLPPPVPRSDAIQSFVTQETPIVRIRCDDGSEGIGYSYTIGTGGSSVIALLRDHLAPRLIGRDPALIEAIWHDLMFATHATTVGAITSLALAAIDTALWDWRCRRDGQPLWVAAGGAKQRIPVYTTEGGWLHLPVESLVEQTVAAKEAGFKGAKIKVGKPHVSDDVARLSAVRDAVGDDFEIMVDANQCFTLSEALRRAPRYAELGIAWFEEPLPADDIVGHQRLAAASAVPIAVGESLYSPRRWHHAVAEGRAPRRVLQPRGVSALPDGVARLAVRGGAVGGLGRVHPAARRGRDQPHGHRRRPRRRAQHTRPGHRLALGRIAAPRTIHRYPHLNLNLNERPP